MNTEKIEKLKKTLSSTKLPADLKPKIEAEIKRLEDLDAKESEAKEEVKPVAKKTTTRKPRATKTVAKKTSTRKPSQTSKPKRTPMSLAKEIRKEGESWSEARARASKMMKEKTHTATKDVESELDKLTKLVRGKKELKGQIGRTNLLIDAKRKAKPMGRRISKDGNVYYENRANRTDKGTFGKYHLAEGGGVEKSTFKYYKVPNENLYAIQECNSDFEDGYGSTCIVIKIKKTEKEAIAEVDRLNAKGYAEGGYLTDPTFGNFQSQVFAKGGGVRTINGREYSYGRNWTNDHNLTNKGEEHEVKYTRKKRFELGGTVVTDLAGHTGGSLGGDPTMLDGMSGTSYTGLVGETGAMSSGEMFMAGGSIDKNFDLSGYRKYRTFNDLEEAKEYVDMDRKKYPRVKESVVIKEGNRYQVWMVPATGIETGNRVYELGGGLPSGVSQSYMITESLGNPAQHFAKGGGIRRVGGREYPLGRNWTNDHEHVNKGEEHEVNYTRKGKFLGIFAGGGSLSNEFKEVEDFGSEQYFIRDFGHVIIGDDKKIELVVVARLIDLDDFMSEDEIPSEGKYQLDFDLVPKGKYLSKSRKNEVNDEDNSVSSITEINVVNYMGGLRFEPSDKNFFKTFESAKKHLMSKELNEKITGMGIMSGFIMDMPYNRMGKTNWEQLNYILGLTDSYAKGGGVRRVGNREYSLGRNWTNDHEHVNKAEQHETNYTRKKSFAGGGAIGETPKIYVADLEAYNNGRLSGVWLDLADYNDADELMEAIQDFLKTSGGEEYAIHDAEYIPSIMYSEYMGQRDFEELYEMIDLAKDNNLPLSVVQEVVSQYDASAVEEFQGKYDNAEDFAQQLVDDIGIESFTDFQYYLEVSDTDRRLLAQDMADSYVDDIRDEDGGNRLIEEAGLDVDEYEEANSEMQEEMLEKAREIVYDEYYNNWFEGLSDPYYFLVEEQGMYDAESFANANFVRVDYEKLGDALEQDYTFIYDDGELYVFNIR